MATIAHEGNPRSTSALTVSGVFDGTVTLNVNFALEDIRSNFPEVTARSNLTNGGSGGCPEQLAYNNPLIAVEDLNTAERFKTLYVQNSIQAVTPIHGKADANAHDLVPPWLIAVASGLDYVECPLAGFISREMGLAGGTIPNSFTSGGYIEFGFTYWGPLQGTPITGLCFRVAETSTIEVFTGYALLFNEVSRRMEFWYFKNQSLLDGLPNPAQMLASTSLPSAGSAFFLEDFNDSFGATVGERNLRDWDSGSVVMTFTSSVIPWERGAYRQSNTNAGWIWLPVDDGDSHIAQWKAVDLLTVSYMTVTA